MEERKGVITMIQLTEKEREKIIEQFIKAGAVRREKPLKPGDDYYSCSIGEKGKPIPKIWIR